jgi:uncharacterized protein (DUF1778 family)
MATKTERLDLRLTASQDEIRRRAAEANGDSMSGYVLRHAIEAAETYLADRRVFVLDDEAWERLQSALDRPAARKGQLTRLLSVPSVLERG